MNEKTNERKQEYTVVEHETKNYISVSGSLLLIVHKNTNQLQFFTRKVRLGSYVGEIIKNPALQFSQCRRIHFRDSGGLVW